MTTPAPSPTTPPSAPPRVLRRRSGAVLAGVAGGIADHLELPAGRVRLVVALLAALGGAGVLAYGALWIWCPLEPDEAPEHPITPTERRRALGLAVLGVVLAVVVGALDTQLAGIALGPIVLAVLGVGLVWREADPDVRRRADAGGSPSGRARGRWVIVRVLTGVVLVVAGIVGFLLPRAGLGQVSFAALAAVVAVVGVALLTLPWAVGFARAYAAERRERVRASERAEIAAHLHDSVLQTLALIQRHTEDGGDDPARAVTEVRRLARRQERELRHWLYDTAREAPATEGDGSGPAGPGTPGAAAVSSPGPAGLAAALAAAAAEVEDAFAVTAAPVVVGDTALDEPLAALVAAAREAMVNAAKHAEVFEVSVYAEVEPGEVSVFVRDRGRGFDPAAVGPDRHGLADSVRGRVARHGGTATVRSAPGKGAEVALTMPRATDGPTDAAVEAAPPTDDDREAAR